MNPDSTREHESVTGAYEASLRSGPEVVSLVNDVTRFHLSGRLLPGNVWRFAQTQRREPRVVLTVAHDC